MIYFVRHGESEANVKAVFAGQKENSPLTEKGREQALATAKEIKKEELKINRIISSPLKRSFETAKIIAEEIGFDSSKIVIDIRINEYDMGSLTGTPWGVISSVMLVQAENAEDPESFKDRVCNCIKELNKLSENVLVCSHAGVGRVLETIREGMEAKYFYDLPPFDNASVIKIDWVE
jgi:broad specificity phosphatase PhoE